MQIGDKIPVRKARGGVELVQRDVFDALVAVGIIAREGDGWRMADVDMDAFPELALCDFCNSRPVTWYVEAEAFTLGGDRGQPMPMRSAADWMACEPCGTLIQTGDRAGLLRRTLAYCRGRVPAGYPVSPFLVAQRRMMEQFWRHYRAIRRYATPYGTQEGQHP